MCCVSFGVLTIFHSAGMPYMKHEHAVDLALDAYILYVNHKLWTFHTSPVKCG